MNTSSHRVAEVERYIHELAIALAHLPADEREDVIAGIRGHIDDALLELSDPSVADVQRILTGLGDPQAIAADAGSRPATPPASADTSSPEYPPGFDTPPPVLQRSWIPAATMGAFALSLFMLWLGRDLWLGGLRLEAPALALWMAGVVVLVASPLWSGIEKLVGAAVFAGAPLALVVVDSAAHLLLGFGGPRDLPVFPGLRDSFAGYGLSGLGRIVGVLVLTTFVVVGAWLVARGSARARAIAMKRRREWREWRDQIG